MGFNEHVRLAKKTLLHVLRRGFTCLRPTGTATTVNMGKSKTQEVRVGKQQGSRSAGSSSQSPNPVSSSAPAQSTTTTTTTSSSSSTLRWPDLPFPGRELVLKELIADQVLLLPEFFTPKDCARWTAYLESSGSVAMEPSPAVPKRGEAVRSNERFSVQDEAFAARLHRLLAPYIDRLASRPAGSKPKALSQCGRSWVAS